MNLITVIIALVSGIIIGFCAAYFLRILHAKTANELAHVIASVGLAQNFAAMRALATVGIQKGHMKLHARNIAAAAGAEGDMIEKLATALVKEGKVTPSRASELLKELK